MVKSKKQKLETLKEYKQSKHARPSPDKPGWIMLFPTVKARKQFDAVQQKLAISKKRAERNEQK